ncbi:MAG: hypothetical protein LAP87_07720 [Acidobacteriia bacterium]|nr:hypothetical protein [Terriglobia bacterium]
MDLKLYYQKIRDVEAKIVEAFPVVVSRETGDGGKEGMLTETTRAIAAKMIADGAARLAKPEEVKAFQEGRAEAVRLVEEAAAAAKVQFTMFPTSELSRLRGALRPAKD